MLAEVPRNQNFDMRIYSDGGSFYEAMTIHSLIAERKSRVHAIVDGLAASAASLILQAAGKRSMAKHSSQMIHEVHAHMHDSVSVRDLRKIADQMDGTNKELVDIYSRNWKGSKSDLLSALDAETWLSAEESVATGLADDVVDGPSIAARVNVKMFKYQNIPENVVKAEIPFVPPWVSEMSKKLEAVLAK